MYDAKGKLNLNLKNLHTPTFMYKWSTLRGGGGGGVDLKQTCSTFFVGILQVLSKEEEQFYGYF